MSVPDGGIGWEEGIVAAIVVKGRPVGRVSCGSSNTHVVDCRADSRSIEAVIVIKA